MLVLPMSVGMQGLDALAMPWHALLSAQPWTTSLGTRYGITACLMFASLAAALVSMLSPRRISQAAALVDVLALGAALAASGHASAAPPQWLARPMVFVHAIAITV